MVVQHNLTAMNASRMYDLTSKSLAKTTEKLSSGYKINRAADDAARLSISEKLRRQIRGLNQGSQNIQEGTSFLQVADGAASEVHSILGRLTELAVKASNETTTQADRLALDSEAQSLKAEINRINNTTEFNEQPVFFEAGASKKSIQPTAESAFFKLMAGNVSTDGYMTEKISPDYLKNINYTKANEINGSNSYVGVHIDFGSIVNNGNIEQLKDTEFYVNCCTDCCATVVKFTDDVGTIVSYSNASDKIKKTISIGIKKDDESYYINADEFTKSIVDGLKSIDGHVEFANDQSKLYLYDIDPKVWSENEKKLAYFCDTNCVEDSVGTYSSLWIQMGSDPLDGMYISTGLVDTDTLGISDVVLDPTEKANQSIEKIANAVATTSKLRSRIGAQQNRLESAYNVNNNTVENTTAAESQIRDTDMADMMVNYSDESILSQAGQSMLAQANQSAAMVLSLLQ